MKQNCLLSIVTQTVHFSPAITIPVFMKKIGVFCVSVTRNICLSQLLQQGMLFSAVSNLSGPLRKQQVTSTGSKGPVCRLWLEDLFYIKTHLILIITGGSENRHRQLNFDLQKVCVSEKGNK